MPQGQTADPTTQQSSSSSSTSSTGSSSSSSSLQSAVCSSSKQQSAAAASNSCSSAAFSSDNPLIVVCVVWICLVRAASSRMAVERTGCSRSGERVPLMARGGGGGGYSGGRDAQMASERRSSSSSSSSSRGYNNCSSAGVRVAGAVMIALVLTGLVGMFRSVENARTPAGPSAATSMPAPEETKATVGNDESGTNRFWVYSFDYFTALSTSADPSSTRTFSTSVLRTALPCHYYTW